MNNEILDFMEEEQKENSTFKDTLSALVKKANTLQAKAPFYTETEEFKKIVEFLGEYFPIEKLEQITAYYKEKLRGIVENDIPILLMGAGIKETTLETGEKVEISRIVSLTKKYIKDENGLYIWLDKKGYGDAIKKEYAIAKGSPTEELEGFLSDQGIDYTRKEGVHSATLNKIMVERLDEAESMSAEEKKKFEPLPPEKIAEVQIFNRAKIK
jgi:hypothetical protein